MRVVGATGWRRVAMVAVWASVLATGVAAWRLIGLLSGGPPPAPAGAAGGAPDGRRAPAVRTDVGDASPWWQRGGEGWQVVHQLSAHHVLVVEVETERVGEALAIAHQLVDPVKAHYTECLVYIFRPGRRGGLPAARVQWTPRGGYVATWYAETARGPR